MSPLGDIPFDLARQICTSATIGDRSLAIGLALSSTCKLIQEWVDPFVFRHLTFGKSSVDNYLCLQTEHASRRFVGIRPFVWSFHFAMDCSLEFIQLEELMSLHPSIKTLYIHGPLPYGADALQAPSLTHLSAAFLSYESGDFSGPLFSQVTHLDLRHLDISDLPDAAVSLSLLPLVEALVIGGEVPAIEETVSILPNLPSHVRLVICYVNVPSLNDYEELGDVADDLASGKIDPRVVVCISEVLEKDDTLPGDIIIGDHLYESHRLWDWRVPEDETFWAQARDVLEQRRRREIES
ncbi:hypothetical protein DL96DRAFT_1821814 [Flagelloscypha sp. PMI_526]|nr:hypothetical protein DL96DRAFT_1821814 [Flagelloscypha sp. PMI_526]